MSPPHAPHAPLIRITSSNPMVQRIPKAPLLNAWISGSRQGEARGFLLGSLHRTLATFLFSCCLPLFVPLPTSKRRGAPRRLKSPGRARTVPPPAGMGGAQRGRGPTEPPPLPREPSLGRLVEANLALPVARASDRGAGVKGKGGAELAGSSGGAMEDAEKGARGKRETVKIGGESYSPPHPLLLSPGTGSIPPSPAYSRIQPLSECRVPPPGLGTVPSEPGGNSLWKEGQPRTRDRWMDRVIDRLQARVVWAIPATSEHAQSALFSALDNHVLQGTVLNIVNIIIFLKEVGRLPKG